MLLLCGFLMAGAGKAFAQSHCDSVNAVWSAQCTGNGNYNVQLQFTGVAPFHFSYSDGSNLQTVDHVYTSNYFFTYSNSGSNVVSLSLTGAGDSLCLSGGFSFLPLRMEPAGTPPVAANDTLCGTGNPQSATLSATGPGKKFWYGQASGGSLLATGNVFTTPLLTAYNTTYYAESVTDFHDIIGRPDTSTGAGNSKGYELPSSGNGLVLSVSQHSSLDSLVLYAKGVGQVVVRLRDATNTRTLDSTIVNISIVDTGIGYIVNTRFDLPAGYYMLDAVGTGIPLLKNSFQTFPYPLGNNFIKVFGAINGSTDYFYFYRMGITATSCPSARVPVTAVIKAPGTPVVIASGPLTFCPGDSVLLTATSTGGDGSGTPGGGGPPVPPNDPNGPGNNRFIWNTGDTTATITVKADGAYFVRNRDLQGCTGFSSDTFNVYTGSPFDLVNDSWTTVTPFTINTTGGYKTVWPQPSTGYYMDGAVVRKTTDNGTTWTAVTPSGGAAMNDILFTDVNNGYVVSGNQKLFKTTNGGTSWTTDAATFTGFGLVSIAESPDHSLFIGQDGGGLFYSTTGGTSWNLVNFTAQVPIKGFSFPGGKVGYALYTTGSILKTDDYTTGIWNEIGLPANSNTFNSLYFSNPQNGWLVGDQASVFHTTDGGGNWQQVTMPGGQQVQTHNYITFTSAKIGFITATNNRVFKTLNGGQTWAIDTAGLTTRTYSWNHIAVSNSGYKFLAGPNQFKKSVPTVTATASALTFCLGDSVLLSAPAGYNTYLWNNGKTGRQIHVNVPGSYNVRVGQGSNCLFAPSNTLALTYKSAPAKPTLTAGGPVSFCTGDSVVITASALAGPYLWSSGDTGRSITVKQSAKIAVRIQGLQCVSPVSDTLTVTVVPPAPKPIVTLSGSPSFCPGNSVTLTAPDGYTNYFWNTGEVTQSITTIFSGIHTVKVGNSGGCVSLPSDTVVTAVLPVAAKPSIVIQGARGFCFGDSVILTDTTAGPRLWSTGDTARSIVVRTTQRVAFSKSTTATYCQSPASDSVSIRANPVPAPPVVISSYLGLDTMPLLCGANDSVRLSVPSAPGQYFWSTGSNAESIYVHDTGTYSVLYFSELGCGSQPTKLRVQRDAADTATISQTGTLNSCHGDSVILRATGGHGRYQWSTGQIADSITVRDTGDYYVQVLSTKGCLGVKSGVFKLRPVPIPALPVITAPIAYLCAGSTSITLSVQNPQLHVVYKWTGGDSGITHVVHDTGYYRVIAKSTIAPCRSDSSVAFKVTAGSNIDAAVVDPQGPTTFCAGDSVQLVASVAGGTAGTYLWQDNFTGPSRYIKRSGTYKVWIVDPATGCSSAVSNPTIVTVNPKPVRPTITATPGVGCEGQNILLTCSAQPGPNSFFFYFSGQPPSTVNTTTVTGTAGLHSFRVAVASAAGCISDSSIAVQVFFKTVFPTPVITYDTTTQIMSCSNISTFAYHWYRNGVLINPITQSFHIDSTGSYYVIPFSGDTCGTIASSVFNVSHVHGTVGITSLNNSGAELYPNPGTDALTLRLPAGSTLPLSNAGTTQYIRFTDALGRNRNVKAELTGEGTFRLNTTDLAAGVYMVHLPLNTGHLRASWVKQ